MIPDATLVLSGAMHTALRRHLFPGDGLEAAAILVCARTPGPRLRFIARELISVPHDECKRQRDALTWPGAWIETAIDVAEKEALALFLVHSHPGGLFAFSEADDASDRRAVADIFNAHGDVHGGAIMVPSGAMRARYYERNGNMRPIDLVTVAGDDISFWWDSDATPAGPRPRPIAFTVGMTGEVGRLHAGLIGVSGTGSVVGEQAVRLGFGRITSIDFDKIERKNLNRILNSGIDDIGRLKVDVFARAAERHRDAGVVTAVAASVATREAVLASSQCDVLFCCVDTLEARQIADLIAAAFLIPLIDVGVVIPIQRAPDGAVIADVLGRVDYVQPGGASLGDRGVYTPASLRAEYLRRVAADAHQQEMEAGYIPGLQEEAPAVISLNMRAGAAAMNEFIARAYLFRHDDNARYARTQFSLAACEEEYFAEGAYTRSRSAIFARGALEPLLGLPGLQKPLEAA